jgi:hypothetical protein
MVMWRGWKKRVVKRVQCEERERHYRVREYRVKVKCSRGREYPELQWVNGVKAAVELRRVNIEYARMCM